MKASAFMHLTGTAAPRMTKRDKETAGETNLDPNAKMYDRPQANGGGGSNEKSAGCELSEEQLMEVFKQTSVFNVKSALANNDCLLEEMDTMFCREASDIKGNEEWEEFRGFWSDDEDWEERPVRRARSASGSKRIPGPSRGAASTHSRPRQHLISTFNSDTGSFIRRSFRAVAEDQNAVHLVKVPPYPIPVAWGRIVKPWRPPSEHHPAKALAQAEEHVTSGYHEVSALELCNFRHLKPVDFQAVFINSGWEECGGINRLRRLPVPSLCPVGFVFAWVPKALVHDMMKLMYSWGFIYVENLTWVQTAPSNAMLELESEYFRSSHLTLYIFRKNGTSPPPPCPSPNSPCGVPSLIRLGLHPFALQPTLAYAGEGKDIELKHQRNPDVTFDCVCSAKGK